MKNGVNLFLIDGNAYFYRAFYAIKDLKNSEGQPTNAVYGFTKMLFKVIETEKPDLLAVIFDFPGPTFRHEKYKEYKAGRQPMPENLISQIPLIKEVIKALNIKMFEIKGFEADDVIATIADRASKEEIKTKIMTPDKDILQIVNDDIKVVNAYKEDLVYDRNKVKEKLNVYPEEIPDFLALTGDPADNVPGVPGIGEKTAAELISKFKNIEEIISNISSIENEKVKNSLNNNKEHALSAKKLLELVKDVPLEFDFESLRLVPPDEDKLRDLFVKLDFKTLLSEIPQKTKSDYSTVVLSDEAIKTNKIDDVVKIKKKVKSIKAIKKPKLIVDITSDDLLFSVKPGEVMAIPFNGDCINAFREILEDSSIEKYGINLKKVITKLNEFNIKLSNIKFDLGVASYILNKNYRFEDQHGIVDSVIKLSKKFLDELKEKMMLKLFYEIEMPLIEVLSEMEGNGIKLDLEFLKGYSNLLEENLKKLTSEIYDLAGEEFNINSSQQLSKILFEKLGLPKIKKIKTGYSTSVDVLENLANKYELPAKILDYRTLYKLKSTYVDTLPELINKKTGKIHTSFNQTITSTGRLSSSNPNLQNIPVKTDIGKLFRKVFIPSSEENIFISADYSQIEIRVLAHVSEDKHLIEAFKKDEDIHTATAADIFDVSKKEVTPSMRRIAKTVNFGIIYGMSAFGLSKELKINRKEAANYIDNYFNKYEGVKNYIEETVKKTRETGYVATIFGRRRYIPDINSKNRVMREFAERAAVNMPIQGSAADIIKLAMIEMNSKIKKLNVKMLIQVHDELLFDVPNNVVDKAKDVIKETMENIVKLNVPLKVDIKTGKNWYEAH